MHPGRSLFTRRALGGVVLLAAVAGAAVTGALVLRDRASAAPSPMGTGAHDHMNMSQAEMDRAVNDWYAVHPARGAAATAAPVDSFLASGTNFEEDGNGAATQVDTAKIVQGQVILWKLGLGSHTVTSGTGAADPQAGLLFDQPLSSLTNTTFTFQFNDVGIFPFFCRPHELFNMRGVVVVSSAVGVEPLPGPAHAAGFVGSPWPNPARGGVTFRFALARAGHAVAGVWDVRGRRVATPLEADLPAGDFSASWDGRTLRGELAPAGVYLLRLEVPGATDVRRLVLDR